MLFFRWLGIVFAIFISDASAGLENAVVDRNEQEGKGGGCRDWIPHVSTAYDSVITVLDEVVSTLEGLQHSEPVETAPNKKYLEYFRVNSMFQVLLNTNVLNEGGGLSSRAKTYLGELASTLSLVRKKLTVDQATRRSCASISPKTASA